MNLKNMWKKHTPEIETKEPHLVNGMPWPRLPKGEYDKVPLQEEYRHYSMDYLDSAEAKPIFEAQADYIMKHGHKTLVDIGCRHGPVNDILFERGYIDEDYHYFGFDTSTESIHYAQEVWKEFPNITYRVGTYKFVEECLKEGDVYNEPNVPEDYKVDFEVDCIIWSGVLLYEPTKHQKYFQDTQIAYGARHAIIQEPMQDQRIWREGLELNTIARYVQLHYKNKYHAYEDTVTDCDIFSGRRLIAHITCHREMGRRANSWFKHFMYGLMCGPMFKIKSDAPSIRYTDAGEKMVPYIWQGKVNPRLTYLEIERCRNALDLMDHERYEHRLGDNYNAKGLHLDKMLLYNFVFNSNDQVMFGSGAQWDGDAVRVFSRYFSFEQFKTDGKNLFEKVDKWSELTWTIEILNSRGWNKLIYWSRDKSPKFFERLKIAQPTLFEDWQVHPAKIEIIYPNNKQYIFFTGDINEILHNRK